MSTFGTTAKWALRYLLGSNVVSDIDAGFQALAEDLDGKLTPYDEGLLSARPVSTPGTPGIKGREYRATDDPAGGPNGMLYRDYGTGWMAISAGQPLVPIGTVLMTAAATADAGYLLCDGTAVSRSGYPGLFGRIGTTHGAGNGSTTFNVPDLRGRAPVGAGTAAGAAGATAHALGAKGGEETHQLTTAELASHAHIFNAPAAGRDGSSGWSSVNLSNSGGTVHLAAVLASQTISDVNGVAPNGGDGPHNNMQPFTAVNFQIKT